MTPPESSLQGASHISPIRDSLDFKNNASSKSNEASADGSSMTNNWDNMGETVPFDDAR